MKKIYSFLFAVLSFVSVSNAQNYCSGNRYIQEVFAAYSLTSNITYGSNTSSSGSATTLKMDIYEPQGDNEQIRPLVVFAHGGSFIGGDKAQPDTKPICEKLAKRGYVVASINYRIGMWPINQTNATKAVLRAVQDMKAAVRYFWKDAVTTNTYKIDTNNIFVGGSSAGAFMALHYAYMDKYSELNGIIDSNTIVSMGGFEGTSGNPGYPCRIKAGINLCGALGKKEWAESGNVPMVSMHGTQDGTVPYATSMIQVSGFNIMVVDGSKSVKDRTYPISLENPFYTWYNADHIPFASNANSATWQAYLDTTMAFVGNFLYKQLGCTLSGECPLPNSFYDPAASACTLAPESNGVKEIKASLFSVYPNPSNDKVYLQFAAPVKGKLTVQDISGRILRQENISGAQAEVMRESLASGIYFISVMESGSAIEHTEKVVFE